MIDYGEDKVVFGAPKIAVGVTVQLISACYIAGFLLLFFLPETGEKYLEQCNAVLSRRPWTLLSGALLPGDGLSLIIAFILAFLLFRPLETFHPLRFPLFFAGAALTGGAALWLTAPEASYAVSTWIFPFAAASVVSGRLYRGRTFLWFKRRIAKEWIYFGAPVVLFVILLLCRAWENAIGMFFAMLYGLFFPYRRQNPDKNKSS